MERLDWATIEQAASEHFEPVSGGFTEALRGLVTLADGSRLFIKQAIDDQTLAWVHKEVATYEWLEQMGYPYAPRLVASDETGLALPDLSTHDWQSQWNTSKVDAVLMAMDALAALGDHASSLFKPTDFGDSLWQDIPEDTTFQHIARLPSDLREAAVRLHKDTHIKNRYHAHAKTRPYQGTELIHGDVRADNFAYDTAQKTGLLVDWNWAGLGSKNFDQTAFLVDVHKHFDVFEHGYAERIDLPSIGWLIGFWLHQASLDTTSDHMAKLRVFQLESAVRAHDMYEQLTH